ncbi:MAG: calcium/sodium antiporter [Hyphomicrobiales bacterium]|nr:calcium/sodium antiporter [Hyphomicrobiales bacterium]
MVYVMLIAGIGMLLFCGDLLVRGAVALAVKLDIPALVIGLTIVAFGTSAPELVVSLRAALSGSPGIAIGNVVGSNIANVFLVLGLPALICATNCDQPFIRRNMFYVLGASLLFISLCFYDPLTFWHGVVLFALMIAFLIESGRRAAKRSDPAAAIGSEAIELIDGVQGLPVQNFGIIGCVVAGLIGLPLGAQMTVTSASTIAENFGVSEATIGLTIVALGTSLPELATTMSAALRKQAGLALGNVLGSNLFNILAIAGLTAMVTPVPVPDIIKQVDIWVMLAAALAITPFILRRGYITRAPGIAFVAIYIAYIFFAFTPRAEELASLYR